jgi:methylisocitrate lyase
MHLEDQAGAKRCGHRPNKELVDAEEMVDRIRAAVDARIDPAFTVMARTDALASEGLERTLARVSRYVEAGADAIFAEAVTTIDEYRRFVQAVDVPVLANLTEFGATPLFALDQLRDAGVRLALYPLSAFRAMNRAADDVYRTIRRAGTQAAVVDTMQTRAELYDVIGYHEFENRLDSLRARAPRRPS